MKFGINCSKNGNKNARGEAEWIILMYNSSVQITGMEHKLLTHVNIKARIHCGFSFSFHTSINLPNSYSSVQLLIIIKARALL